MGNERLPQGDEKAAPSVSLRGYWTNPTGFTHATRRSIQGEPASSMFEHASPMPVLVQKPMRTRYGVTQTALPLTWYAADNDAEIKGEPSPSLQQLQKHIEQRGVQSLSNTELLALVLKTGAGKEDTVRRIHSLLTSYSVQELLSIEFGELSKRYDLGTAKAAQVQAMLEVSRRLTLPSEQEKYTIKSPFDAAMLVIPEMAHLDHEELRVLVLDTRNHVVANILMYQGTVNSSVIRAGEIFRPAVTRKCPSIIICHNHPSGDPTPSPEDESVTKQLVEAGKVLEVDLLDHLVIGHNQRFISLKEKIRW